MTSVDIILRLLKNSGFRVLGTDGTFIYLEDPSCILRSFETFIEYAWIGVTAVTALLLFGWGISLIRAGKGASSMFTNIRNLTLIFGVLSISKPIVNFVYGDDVFARGCKTITVSISQVQKILDARNLALATRNTDDLYEEFDIYDSGAIGGGEYAYMDDMNAMTSVVYAAGDAQPIPTTISGGTGVASGTNNRAATSSGTIAPVNARYDNISTATSNMAVESGNDIIYTDANGNKTKRSGGTRAWRNNNPGNIIAGKWANSHGAIGKGGRFAVFASEAAGMNAIAALLKTSRYAVQTVAGAISTYAPPFENDTAAYHRRLEQLTGIPINTPMSQLTEDQLKRVTFAIREIEGWKPGRETQI